MKFCFSSFLKFAHPTLLALALVSQAIAGTKVVHKTIQIGGHSVFYREAGDPAKPTLLLLHGYPTSSYMFRNLMPLLSANYHLLAPDMPGFGRTTLLNRSQFSYTFANLTTVIEAFVQTLGIDKYTLYLMDYGAPVGLRLALRNPAKIEAIISQNGNAYKEGLNKAAWASIITYWESGTKEDRDKLRAANSEEGIRWGYLEGVPGSLLPRVSPDNWALDAYYLGSAEAQEIQLDLFYDYRTNVQMYPKFHQYFRTQQPPLLGIWGKHDPYFQPAGLKAFQKDLPKAELHLLDASHFALETHCQEIAELIHEFLVRKLRK